MTEKKIKRAPSYRKPNDDLLLPKIKIVTDERGTYGYRRVTALLNRRHKSEGLSTINHKRVYRIMKQNGLLLQRHTGRPTRTHDGKVITLKSNLRWCSDSFEIRAWNGERVQVAFALDCCDREIMSWVATSKAIDGQMIRDLMAESIEQRFGAQTKIAPSRLEWLSDNGPPYTAYETRAFGALLGLVVVNTPSYSPESNGMAEAFVKTFKRDYVYLNRLESAESILRQLPTWFEDYNNIHPHKGLGMRSPREFRQLKSSDYACLV